MEKRLGLIFAKRGGEKMGAGLILAREGDETWPLFRGKRPKDYANCEEWQSCSTPSVAAMTTTPWGLTVKPLWRSSSRS